MKLAELEDKLIYAYRPRTSEDVARPAKVVEPKLWRRDEVWGYWDGAEKRTKQTVVTRAQKGDRAGRSDSWSARSWAVGVPVLIIDEMDYMWVSAKTRIMELPFVIFAKAWAQMNPHKLVEEGHDGRFTGDISARTTVEVPMSDGSTRSVKVTLEFVRPQALIDGWNSHAARKKEQAEQEILHNEAESRRRAQNNLVASEIRNRVQNLLGEERLSSRGERYDLHRKDTSSGISTTYEVSEETLLKLLALAEKGSGQ